MDYLSTAERATSAAWENGVFLEYKFPALFRGFNETAKAKAGHSGIYSSKNCDGKCWYARRPRCICSCNGRSGAPNNHGIALDPDRIEEYKSLVKSKLPASKVEDELARGKELVAQATREMLRERTEFEEKKEEWTKIAIANGGCGREQENRVDRMPCGTNAAQSKTQKRVIFCKVCKQRKQDEYNAYWAARKAKEQAEREAQWELNRVANDAYWVAREAKEQAEREAHRVANAQQRKRQKEALLNGGCGVNSFTINNWQVQLEDRNVLRQGETCFCGELLNSYIKLCPYCSRKTKA
jgi:hypothetical protein